MNVKAYCINPILAPQTPRQEKFSKIALLTTVVIALLIVLVGVLSYLGTINFLSSGGSIGMLTGGAFLVTVIGLIGLKRSYTAQSRELLVRHVPIETEQQKKFKEAALTTFQEQSDPKVKDLPSVEGLDLRKALKTYNSSVAVLGSNRHLCKTIVQVPGVVFKTFNKPAEIKLKEEVEIAEEAQRICREHNLYLLHVPLCKGIYYQPPTHDDKDYDVVMQEKLDLEESGYGLLEGAGYQWAIHDPDLQPYIYELLRQLTVFICLIGFEDVKYGNIALTKEGRVALFDLDRESGINGLTCGSVRGVDFGLFNILPPRWIEEFKEIAIQRLGIRAIEQLEKALPLLVKNAQKRESIREKHMAFMKAKGIASCTEQIPEPKGMEEGAIQLITSINEKFEPSLDLSFGRRILVPMKLWKDARENQKRDLKALQEKGHICCFEKSSEAADTPYFAIYC